MATIFRKILHLPAYLFYHTSWYGEQQKDGIGKFLCLNNYSLKVVTLGGNEALADYAAANQCDGFMNWALKNQSLEYDYSILKNYYSYLSEKAVVIITVSPMSLIYTVRDLKLNDRYYTILHPATIYNFKDSRRSKEYLFSGNPIRADFKRSLGIILSDYGQSIVSIFKSLAGKSMGKDASKKAAEINRLITSETRKFGSLEKAISAKMIVLEDIIDFCNERELRPVFVIPPYHEELRKRIESFINMDRAIERIRLKGVVLNYYNGHNGLNEKHFESSATLNETGSEIFVDQIASDLQKIGISIKR